MIVDDEPMARQALYRMLAEFPEIHICGQADSVAAAASLVVEPRADVVFLDIELIGESGFDLVPMLDENLSVVFVTAFDQYAIRAFEINALDYLLKPITRGRLGETVRRLLDRTVPGPNLLQLGSDDLIWVHYEKRRHWLPLEQVCLVEASAEFTIVRSAGGLKATVWKPMSEWEKIQPEDKFVRIHRGRIVNLAHVDTFETLPGNRLRLHLTGIPEPCDASRRFFTTLRKRLMAPICSMKT